MLTMEFWSSIIAAKIDGSMFPLIYSLYCTLPGHYYIGPYNPLDKQLRYDPETGQILEYYQKPTGATDMIAAQHDVHYSVCKDDKKCNNKADRKMVKALDKVPLDHRQWGHWLA